MPLSLIVSNTTSAQPVTQVAVIRSISTLASSEAVVQPIDSFETPVNPLDDAQTVGGAVNAGSDLEKRCASGVRTNRRGVATPFEDHRKPSVPRLGHAIGMAGVGSVRSRCPAGALPVRRIRPLPKGLDLFQDGFCW